MIRVVENHHVPREERIVTDRHALGYAHDPSIVEADSVSNDQFRVGRNVPSARTPDVDIVPDLDPTIADDEGRSSLEIESPSDARATIAEQRLAIEEFGDEVP